MAIVPEPGSQLASFGVMRFSAPHGAGEVSARRGHAWGGVRFDSARGDRGRTEAVEYDGTFIRGNQPVDLTGPGYRVRGHGLLIQADGSRLALVDGVNGVLQEEAPR